VTRSAIVAMAAGLSALAAWEATLRRQSVGAHWSVGLVIVAAGAAAFLAGRHRQERAIPVWVGGAVRSVARWREVPLRWRLGVAVWVILIMAVIGWDLNSFVHQAHDLPTLSRLFGVVTGHEVGRGLVFAAWLGAGWYLVTGRRRPVAR
jgi:hypothetical protein